MINIQHNIALDKLNTFGMQVNAPYLTVLTNSQECIELADIQPANTDVLVLGGGSNMLFTKDLNNKWLIKNEIKGIELLFENDEHVYLSVGAGEVWHDFVLYCIAHGYAGVENLSLIPGTVGAAPIQNIGAYGVEVKQLIEKVRYWDLTLNDFFTLDNFDCQFGYRDSIFKHALKGNIIITEVIWKLSKKAELNTSYGNIKEALVNKGIENPSIKDVSDAVIAIRTEKLPDPKKIGNAGSFFKNPEVNTSLFASLKEKYTEMPGYKVSDTITKIPAAWLIETAGWKGYREADAGVHTKQALVLVNYGNAKGTEIYALSTKVIDDVMAKFGIQLEREVQII